MSAARELFRSRAGFILAAAGSAIGLGNMWRFPYQTAEGGGAAFVLLYLFMTMLIGVPVMAAEFIVGRRTRLSPIGALNAVGGGGWTPLGILLVLTPLLILAYFSVVTGWTLQYAFDAVKGVSADPAARYAEVSTGASSIGSHLVVMAVTAFVVGAGVRRGLERAALILMPTLIVLLIGLAIWVMTLDGAGEGYAFYLQPSLESLRSPTVLRQAASQAFLSLSVGMGVMITYASYLTKQANIGREAIFVSFSDFSVAFVGGLVVFPIIFGLGLSAEVSGSTMGTLFISIPSAFGSMGAIGQLVGVAFFLALLVAGFTSLFSLLEVVVASIMDQFGGGRTVSALTVGFVAALVGVIPAMSQDALGVLDKLAGELFVVSGVLGMSVLVGWVMPDPMAELVEGASPWFNRVAPGLLFTIRYVVPPLVAIVLWFTLHDTVTLLFR